MHGIHYYLVIRDDENRIFNVFGSNTNDTRWDRENWSQKFMNPKRKLACFVPIPGCTKEEIIQQISSEINYEYVSERLI